MFPKTRELLRFTAQSQPTCISPESSYFGPTGLKRTKGEILLYSRSTFFKNPSEFILERRVLHLELLDEILRVDRIIVLAPPRGRHAAQRGADSLTVRIIVQGQHYAALSSFVAGPLPEPTILPAMTSPPASPITSSRFPVLSRRVHYRNPLDEPERTADQPFLHQRQPCPNFTRPLSHAFNAAILFSLRSMSNSFASSNFGLPSEILWSSSKLIQVLSICDD